jgi:hypothetical protein
VDVTRDNAWATLTRYTTSESLLRHALAVAMLAARARVGHAQHAAGVDAARESLEDARALLVREGRRRRDVPCELDARGRRVHVLPARAARARRAIGQLSARDRYRPGNDAVARVLHHSCDAIAIA